MASTKFWIDPEEELTGVFMIQIFPDNGTPYGGFFQELVYQAIVD
jgi:hypothetical protein